MLRAGDFSFGLLIIALCYAMVMVFGMTSPFLIEHVFNYSPVISGYAALLSGVSLMTGGIISKSMLRKPLNPKVLTGIILQLLFALMMIGVTRISANIYMMMAFVIAIHLVAGFVFNNVFAYCLGRFTKNAGVASGLTGGSLFIITSILGYSITGAFHITSPLMLGVADLLLGILLLGTFALFRRAKEGVENRSRSTVPAN